MLGNLLRLGALIYVSFILASCGDTTHRIEEDLPSQIEVVHKISLEDIEAVFINQCEEEFNTQEEIDQCVNDKLDGVLDLINNLLNQNEVQ